VAQRSFGRSATLFRCSTRGLLPARRLRTVHPPLLSWAPHDPGDFLDVQGLEAEPVAKEAPDHPDPPSRLGLNDLVDEVGDEAVDRLRAPLSCLVVDGRSRNAEPSAETRDIDAGFLVPHLAEHRPHGLWRCPSSKRETFFKASIWRACSPIPTLEWACRSFFSASNRASVSRGTARRNSLPPSQPHDGKRSSQVSTSATVSPCWRAMSAGVDLPHVQAGIRSRTTAALRPAVHRWMSSGTGETGSLSAGMKRPFVPLLCARTARGTLQTTRFSSR